MQVKPLTIGKVKLNNNIFLAPMAGYTDYAFRDTALKTGYGLSVTELVSAKGLCYGGNGSKDLLYSNGNYDKTAVQLFGCDPYFMRKAIELPELKDFNIVDINMGCPVPKVLKSEAGSKYLQDVDRIYNTVKAVVESVNKPVTVKIRIGWDHNSINVIEVSDAIIKAGAKAIAIHGRTKTDMYSGTVNYDLIKQVKERHPDFPIIANGDITTPEKAKEVLEYTKCDAVMIGRASYGNPYIFKQINHYLETGELLEDLSLLEKMELLKEYALDLINYKGEFIGMKELRGQAGWFIKGCRNGANIRRKLSMISTYTDLLDCLERVKEML